MSNILTSSALAAGFSAVLLLAGWTLSYITSNNRGKSSAFECGFDTATSARIPISMRFFLLAVIFLVFDVEIVLLFPFIINTWHMTGPHLAIFLHFLLILFLGTIHEWNEASLDWSS